MLSINMNDGVPSNEDLMPLVEVIHLNHIQNDVDVKRLPRHVLRQEIHAMLGAPEKRTETYIAIMNDLLAELHEVPDDTPIEVVFGLVFCRIRENAQRFTIVGMETDTMPQAVQALTDYVGNVFTTLERLGGTGNVTPAEFCLGLREDMCKVGDEVGKIADAVTDLYFATYMEKVHGNQ